MPITTDISHVQNQEINDIELDLQMIHIDILKLYKEFIRIQKQIEPQFIKIMKKSTVDHLNVSPIMTSNTTLETKQPIMTETRY